MNNSLINVKNLSLSFESYLGVAKVLDNINFNIEKNKWVGLAGESGCGKSVTAFSILKMLPESAKIESGKIIFKGEDILKKSEKELQKLRGGEISIVFQEPQTALNPSKKVGYNIIESLKIHQKISNKEAKEKAISMLREVRIPQPEIRFNQYPHELSGGMQQRVCIAIALACRPSLIIADEFTTSLDVTIQDEILKLVMELQNQSNMAVLFITHDLALISESCDTVIIMYAGQIMEEGKASEVFDNPSHPYTKMLLDAIPIISEKKERLRSISGSVPSLINPPKGCRFHTRCPNVIKGRCDLVFPEIFELSPNHRVYCHLF